MRIFIVTLDWTSTLLSLEIQIIRPLEIQIIRPICAFVHFEFDQVVSTEICSNDTHISAFATKVGVHNRAE